MGGTALGTSGRSNNGLKLDVKTGKLSLWRLFPTFTFTFTMLLQGYFDMTLKEAADQLGVGVTTLKKVRGHQGLSQQGRAQQHGRRSRHASH